MSKRADNVGRPEWLDLRRLTEYATVSERTLRDWIRLEVNPLPAVQVREKIPVRRSEFDRWIKGYRVKVVDLGDMVEDIVEEIAGGH